MKKTSAYYQRQFRERMRAQGLVKKEVWILPAHAKTLTTIEERLRKQSRLENLDVMLYNGQDGAESYWNTLRLFNALKNDAKELRNIEVDLIDGVAPTIHVTMKDFGDLPIFISVQGDQIIAETILCTVDEIKNLAEFNDLVLKTHKYFPLSTISLDTLYFGVDSFDVYQMFGALSARSSLREIEFEIHMLASNVLQAIEAYSDFLK